MKNIHEAAVLQELIQRFDKLTPATERQWGKMDVAQMMAHCSNAIEANIGDKKLKQTFIGRIFGGFAKKTVVGEKPFRKGVPTAPEFMVTSPVNFEVEKQRLYGLVKRLSAMDPQALAQNVHPFFGKMTPAEWNALNYKHLDHHLRQFGA